MTAEERSDLATIAAQVYQIGERTERIETAIMGDPAMGNAGLVARVQRLESQVDVLLPLARVFGVTGKYWPAAFVFSFFLLTGGDPAAILQLVTGLIR